MINLKAIWNIQVVIYITYDNGTIGRNHKKIHQGYLHVTLNHEI